jgi:small subunit ribosomal protein S17
MSEATTDNAVANRHRRTLAGVVVSDKMDKTVVVQVTRRYRHPRYRKYIQERLRYKAHDEQNTAKVGDKVRIVETRPLSAQKRWALQAIVEKATIV